VSIGRHPVRALALALLLLHAGLCFAASPAPKPSAADVEAWGRLVDTVFASEQLKGAPLPRALAIMGVAALRERKPALGEACLKKAYAAAPEFKGEEGDDYLRVAMELSRDPERRVPFAPFILLYLDLADAKGAKGLASQAGAVKSLRAALATVKSPPPARESPSIESLREVAAASEKWTRRELARAKYRRTTADLRSLGIAFEVYALDNNSLYPAGTLDVVEKKFSPKYIGSVPREDGWGTPFRVETSADRKHFRIVSAGADGSFEALAPVGPTAAPVKRTVDDARRDIVFEDGDLVQEWSEKAFVSAAELSAATAGPALDAESLAEREASRNTMADIRTIATAFEAYKIDKHSYPAGWLEAIEKMLVPTYIMKFPQLDGWGTPFRISTSDRMKSVRIVSAGADRVFEPLPYLDPETRPAPRKVSDPSRDIVFEDGGFIQQLGSGALSAAGKRKARPAPEPTPAEVTAWARLLEAGFPLEPNLSSETLRAQGYLASEARRACLPALAEAILRRVLGEKAEARRKIADGVFGDAWALYKDESRWSETAPFILLYLEQAERLRSEDVYDRADVVAIARARLLTLDVAPVPSRPSVAPSAEILRRLREASDARRAASDARAAEYKRTRIDMVALAKALKEYRVKAKRYPEGGFASVRNPLREFAKGDLPRADAWGTEFRYEGGPSGSTYRLSSAGSDRRFGELPPLRSPTAGVAAESDDPSGDIVMVPGAWLREWSSLALYQSSPDPRTPAPVEDATRYAHGRTLAEIRRVGDALAQYRSDHGRYPDVGNRLVEGTIPGVYIAKVPTHDSWGTAYSVSWSADRKHFRIVSAGADREFESLGEVDPAAAWGPTSLATDPKRDIVFQDGVFLQAYRDAR
jgi:hypothetical protein